MSDYLKHYGVKGQKWGRRQWQNEDGTYTEAGKEHYGWGNGRQNRGHNGGEYEQRKTPWYVKDEYRNMGPRNDRIKRLAVPKPEKSPEQLQQEAEARKAKAKKILAIAGGVALAAAAGVATYKFSGKLRDKMVSEAYSKKKYSKELADKALKRYQDQSKKADIAAVNAYYRKPGWLSTYSDLHRQDAKLHYNRGMHYLWTASKAQTIADNATRRSALWNWLRNRGRIVI